RTVEGRSPEAAVEHHHEAGGRARRQAYVDHVVGMGAVPYGLVGRRRRSGQYLTRRHQPARGDASSALDRRFDRSVRSRFRVRARAATVKNAGAEIAPRSILRNVSREMSAAAATEAALRGPRAARRIWPRARPRSRWSSVSGVRTMDEDYKTGIIIYPW